MSSPLIYDVVAFDAQARTSAVFHPEIEGASVDLLATFEVGSEKAKRVGPSLKALSFLLMGMDHHLNDLARQVDQLVQSSQRTEGYVHKPKAKESWTGIIGRNTYCVPIAINSFFYFSRSMLDQAMDLISCSVPVSCGGSMHWAYEKTSFRRDLRKRNAEPVADLIDDTWRSWANDLKAFRDVIAHHNALPIPSLRFVEDPETGYFTGLEVYFPAEVKKERPGARKPGVQFRNAGTYFPTTRRAAGEFLQRLLAELLKVRQAQ